MMERRGGSERREKTLYSAIAARQVWLEREALAVGYLGGGLPQRRMAEIIRREKEVRAHDVLARSVRKEAHGKEKGDARNPATPRST